MVIFSNKNVGTDSDRFQNFTTFIAMMIKLPINEITPMAQRAIDNASSDIRSKQEVAAPRSKNGVQDVTDEGTEQHKNSFVDNLYNNFN